MSILFIIRLGQKITSKYYADKDRHDHIRAKMTELGRLLLELKRSDIPDIATALLPGAFSNAPEGGSNSRRFFWIRFKLCHPVIGVENRPLVKKMCSHSQNEGLSDIRWWTNWKIRRIWASIYQRMGVWNQTTLKRNKPKLLPLASDIILLTEFFYTRMQLTDNDEGSDVIVGEHISTYCSI